MIPHGYRLTREFEGCGDKATATIHRTERGSYHWEVTAETPAGAMRILNGICATLDDAVDAVARQEGWARAIVGAVSIRVHYFDRDGDPTQAEYATREEMERAITTAFAHGDASTAYVVDAVGKAVERWEPCKVAMCVWEAKS